MTKKKILSEEEKLQRELDKCKEIYDAFKEELHLEGDDINQVHQLVEEGCKLQCMICVEADKIKKEGFKKAEEMLTIDKSTWTEFVKVTAKKLYGELSDKSLEKFNEKIESKRYINNLVQSFYDSYLSDTELKIVDESGNSSFSFDDVEDKEFAELIETYAKVRDYIDKELYGRYNGLAKAAFFITQGKLKRKDFKDLVDWEYYKDSENPEYPSRSWGIYSKFARMYRLLYDYGYDQINDLDYEFGYEIDVKTPHPQTHPWQVEEDED